MASKYSWVKVSVSRKLLYYLFCFSTLGCLFLFCNNYPHIRILLIAFTCTPEDADFVAVKSEHEEDIELFVEVEHYELIGNGKVVCFELNGERYFAAPINNYEPDVLPIEPINFTEVFVTKTDIENKPSRAHLRALYGLNKIKIRKTVVINVILKEILVPFYLYQYCAIVIWLYTLYYIYSAVVIFITLCSVVFTIRGKLYNMKRLRDLAGSNNTVISYETKTFISEQALLPGDCFLVTEGMTLPADSILVQGRVVVDESVLTGESVPVTKTEYKLSHSDPNATKRTANVLYSGTRVVSVFQGSDAVGMAYRTGFRSARGKLIQALIVPQV
jgi:cation-transporting ATPase 13A3/4/5